MSRGRARANQELAEDATLLAGWMYADLLLGLMVIFLATISFVPLDNFISSTLVKTNYKQVDRGFNFNRGLSLVYDEYNSKALSSDIQAFKDKERLSADTEIIFAQVLGGFDIKTESPEAGRNRALAYSFKLGADMPDLFANAATVAGADDSLKKTEIALRLTFVSKLK
jgi:hypothetical protein